MRSSLLNTLSDAPEPAHRLQLQRFDMRGSSHRHAGDHPRRRGSLATSSSVHFRRAAITPRIPMTSSACLRIGAPMCLRTFSLWRNERKESGATIRAGADRSAGGSGAIAACRNAFSESGGVVLAPFDVAMHEPRLAHGGERPDLCSGATLYVGDFTSSRSTIS